MVKLKKCPFCGSDAKDIYECRMYIVECSKCKTKTIHFSTLKEAIDTWNSRANDK